MLASWASDACAIETNPALPGYPTGNVVDYDDIIDALQSLDAGQSADTVTYASSAGSGRRWSHWKGIADGRPSCGCLKEIADQIRDETGVNHP